MTNVDYERGDKEAMIVFSLLALLLLGGVFVALAGGGSALLRGGSEESARESDHGPTPREILDRRLARGEIDGDEYASIRARLEN